MRGGSVEGTDLLLVLLPERLCMLGRHDLTGLPSAGLGRRLPVDALEGADHGEGDQGQGSRTPARSDGDDLAGGESAVQVGCRKADLFCLGCGRKKVEKRMGGGDERGVEGEELNEIGMQAQSRAMGAEQWSSHCFLA